MILLFFERFSAFFPEPGVFTGSHIFFWDRNNVAVISASHVALWGTSFLREDFLNAFYPLVFYIYVDNLNFFSENSAFCSENPAFCPENSGKLTSKLEYVHNNKI